MAYAISGTAQLLQLDSAEPTLPSGLTAEPVSELPGVPITRARPAPHNLHKQGLVKPGDNGLLAVLDAQE